MKKLSIYKDDKVIVYTHNFTTANTPITLSFFDRLKLLFGFQQSVNTVVYFNNEKLVSMNLIINIKNESKSRKN